METARPGAIDRVSGQTRAVRYGQWSRERGASNLAVAPQPARVRANTVAEVGA
jgi:hypothetical protein